MFLDQLRPSLKIANCNLISVIIDALVMFYVSMLATSIMVMVLGPIF